MCVGGGQQQTAADRSKPRYFCETAVIYLSFLVPAGCTSVYLFPTEQMAGLLFFFSCFFFSDLVRSAALRKEGTVVDRSTCCAPSDRMHIHTTCMPLLLRTVSYYVAWTGAALRCAAFRCFPYDRAYFCRVVLACSLPFPPTSTRTLLTFSESLRSDPAHSPRSEQQRIGMRKSGGPGTGGDLGRHAGARYTVQAS